MTLNSRNCADDIVVNSLRTLEKTGKEQYDYYCTEVLEKQHKSFHDPIKKNSFRLFKNSTTKVTRKKTKEIKALQNNVVLFGQLYISVQTRDHDLHEFFEHEIQSYPPSLSNFGELHLPSAKSDLLTCLKEPDNLHPPHSYDCQILDGAAVVHFVRPTGNATFGDYADTTFIPYIDQQLNHAKRVDIVWDAYHPNSLKAVTRQKRGEGVRRKVSEQVKLPRNWGDFLRDSKNKEELFCLLTTKLQQHSFADGKQVFATAGDSFTFY